MSFRGLQFRLLQQKQSNWTVLANRNLRLFSSSSSFWSTNQKPSLQNPPQRSKSNAPNPFALAAIAIAAFGSFAFVVTKRANDPEKHQREQRIPHPDPLKPIRNTTVS